MGTDWVGVRVAPAPYTQPGEIWQVGFDLIGDTTEAMRELPRQRRRLAPPSRKLKVLAKV